MQGRTRTRTRTRIRTRMKKTILFIGYNAKYSTDITSHVERHGFISYRVNQLANIERTVFRHAPDCIIVDVSSIEISIQDIYSKLKKYFSVPVIVLTTPFSYKVEVAALNLGVDDVVTINNCTDVLIARIRRALRFQTAKASIYPINTPHLLSFAGLVIDKKLFICSFMNKAFKLSLDSFELLYFFILNKNRVITRDELYLSLRGLPYDGISRGIDIAISRLKSKLIEVNISEDIILSFRGKGYMFDAQKLVHGNVDCNESEMSIQFKTPPDDLALSLKASRTGIDGVVITPQFQRPKWLKKAKFDD